jgi:hypothetical protein
MAVRSGEKNCRLKNYPVLDTVGPTFHVYQKAGFPIEAFGNDRLLECAVKDLAQLIEKGTLPWLRKIKPFGSALGPRLFWSR